MPATAMPLAQAIGSSAALARLGERLRQSQQRLEAARAVLPPALRPHVRPGPCDERQWVMLAANAPVAAKLRQCLPAVERQLAEAGWPPLELRVRVTAG